MNKRLMTHAVLILAAAGMILPFAWMVLTALKTQNEALRFPPTLWPQSLRVSNFLEAFREVDFSRYFINTVLMTLGITLAVLVTSVLAAYAFARLSFRGRDFLFGLFLAMMMVPMPVYLTPSYVILSRLGWINTFLALIVPWSVNVFAVFLLRQHFKTLPQELFDAARLDGLGHLQILTRIVVPLSRSVLIVIAVFEIIASWNSFLWPLIVTHSDAMRTIQTGLSYFAQAESTNYPLLCAAATFTTLPLIVLYFLLQRQIVQSYHRSGIKE